jgi:hypothetical protein
MDKLIGEAGIERATSNRNDTTETWSLRVTFIEHTTVLVPVPLPQKFAENEDQELT